MKRRILILSVSALAIVGVVSGSGVAIAAAAGSFEASRDVDSPTTETSRQDTDSATVESSGNLELLGETTLTIEAQPRNCDAGHGPTWKCLVAREGDGEPYFIYGSINGVPNTSDDGLNGSNHTSGCEITMVVKTETIPEDQIVTSGLRTVRTFVSEVSRDCSN